LSRAFRLHAGLSGGAAFGNPVAQLVSSDWTILPAVCSDDLIHKLIPLTKVG
jgi:hypothetical protein